MPSRLPWSPRPGPSAGRAPVGISRLASASLVLGCLLASSCGSGSLYDTAENQTTSAPLSYAGAPSVTTDPVVAGQPMTVAFTVQNNTYHILFNVPWQIELGGDPSQIIASGTISEITSNGETAEAVQVTAPAAGSYTLTVVVDPGDTLELGLPGGAAGTTSVVTVTPAPG
jgi:hypothetical protein